MSLRHPIARPRPFSSRASAFLLSLIALPLAAANTPPTITPIYDQAVAEDGVLGPIAFTVGDAETPAANLKITVSSDNGILIPSSNITVTGSGAQRFVTVRPAPYQYGTAKVRIQVTDGAGATAFTWFPVNVWFLNHVPTLAKIPDQTVAKNGSLTIPLTIGDIETPAANLKVWGSTYNGSLIPQSNLVFGGSGANRTLTLKPGTGLVGSTSIRIQVDDGQGGSTAQLFNVTIAESTPVQITSFTSSATSCPYGTPMLLTWTYQGTPTFATVDGVDVLGKTSLQVLPRNRQTFTLTMGNAQGQQTRTFTIAAKGLDTLAGDADGYGYRRGDLSVTRFSWQTAMVQDAGGNLYLGDDTIIRKLDSHGNLSVLAGQPGQRDFRDGVGTDARIGSISYNGMALDEARGLLYFLDNGSRALRVLELGTGVVRTLVGDPSKVNLARPDQFVNAPFSQVSLDGVLFALAWDSARQVLYLAQGLEVYPEILALDPASQTLSTYVGGGWTGSVPSDGPRLQTSIFNPWALALDAMGNLYYNEPNSIQGNLVRKVDVQTGLVKTLCTNLPAGSLSWTSRGTLLASPWFNGGGMYEIDPSTGASTLVEGNGAGVTGTADGRGSAVQFGGSSVLLASDRQGGQWMMDTGRLRTLSASGDVVSRAGHFTQRGDQDGVGSAVRMMLPTAAKADSLGNVEIVEAFQGVCIRRVAPNGRVTTLAGDPLSTGSVDGLGSAARFENVVDVAMDAQNNLWVLQADRIRKVSPTGQVSTPFRLNIVGDSKSTPIDGAIAQATFGLVMALSVNASGELYVADHYRKEASGGVTLRKLTPAGIVSTLAGSYAKGDDRVPVDGDGSLARFSNIQNLACAGNTLYLISNGGLLRKVVDNGASAMVSTLSKPSQGLECSSRIVDGDLATTGRLGLAARVAIHPVTGDVYVMDAWGDNLRVIHNGIVSTLLRKGVNDPGDLANTGVSRMNSLAVTPAGDIVYTTDGAVVQITQ